MKLVERGPSTSLVDCYAHVCFASQRIWVYSRKNAVAALQGKSGCFGSRAGSSQKNTGYGCNLLPSELCAKEFSFNPNPEWDRGPKYLGWRGEMEVEWWLRGRFFYVRAASKKEQLLGIDFFASWDDNEWWSYDVKARDKFYSRLFIQTHEANPDKRHD